MRRVWTFDTEDGEVYMYNNSRVPFIVFTKEQTAHAYRNAYLKRFEQQQKSIIENSELELQREFEKTDKDLQAIQRISREWQNAKDKLLNLNRWRDRELKVVPIDIFEHEGEALL